MSTDWGPVSGPAGIGEAVMKRICARANLPYYPKVLADCMHGILPAPVEAVEEYLIALATAGPAVARAELTKQQLLERA